MAQTLLRGNPVTTAGELPAVGSSAPAFTLIDAQLKPVSLAEFAGKKVVISIFPSIDTPTCATSTRKFNEQAAAKAGTTVLTVSEDLPFALGRFCGAEGIENVHTLSAFRSTFGKDYGVEMTSGPLLGLCARAVVVVDETGKVIYNQMVDDITNEPSYDAALAVLG